ncbi:kinectin-like isoform X2 [Daphnia pulex]|uniref:kinectin-like isoform X2 n=1 Tax=Daphnia pulex TaxID=6669 RepID=UPI001EDE8B54|nr:kinectin-like isoform X2 [Daphnia pulex]XP_046443895.1 kinectin-like isoform X2 [Daphnia pulex]XP_046443896.1 kinectin-like isoform X2 [Daphnia pulex]XP_046443897.1 kinectin-like isoform X2 [Daphnia pulex]
MDLASVLIGLTICAVTAVVLYFISVKSFQEKSFEEVLAEQQQFEDSLLKGEKSNKDKEKKPKKHAVKKNKEKEKGKNHGNAPSAAQSVPFEEKLHVEFEPDAEVIPEEPIAVNVEKKKSDKKEKVKPILRNRDQVTTETFDPDVDSINHFMEHPPKDDVELKVKDKEKTNKKAKVAIEEKVVASEAPIVEAAPVKEVAFNVARGNNNPSSASAPVAPQSQQQPGTPKKQRKRNAKTDSLDTADGGEELLLQLGGTEKLLSALRQLPLTSSELQTMIEVLLNRQQEASGTVESEWMERGGRLDPIGALRKQLADKEKALQEELEEKQAYQNKLRTLGTEMTTERTRAAAARKQLEESLARQTAEMQMLSVRLQQTTEQHVAEVNALRVAVQQAQKASQTSEEHLRQLQRLQDEKNQFDARFATAQQMQQEMGARVQQLEDFLMHKEQQLMEQANQMAIIAGKLQESEQARNGQSHEVQREVAQLREALQAAEAQSLHTAHDARVRLEEMERTKELLENRITKVDRDLAMERSLAAQNEERIRQEVSRLCLENQALNLQLTNATQNRQEDDSKWAAVQEQMQVERNQMAAKESEVQKELENLRSEINSLNQQLSNTSQSRQNDDVKLAAIQEQMQVERNQMAAKEAEAQKDLEHLKSEINSLNLQLSSSSQNRQDDDVKLAAIQEQMQVERNQMATKEAETQKELEQLKSEIHSLNQQLSNSSQNRQDDDVKLAAIQEQMQVERNQLAAKESEAQKELEQLRSETQSLTQQLNETKQNEQDRQNKLDVELKSKDEELETQKRKNNELRDKNYKAMDALAAAEKALVELKKSSSSAKNVPSPVEINQAIGAGLQRVFPELSFDASASPAAFTESLSSQMTRSLERLQSEEQSKAQAQVLHYKTVLSQTEELLNRLQSRVEAEETSWKVKLTQIESDLLTVKQEKEFWMDQCQKQEAHQQQQTSEVDVQPLNAQIESLQKEKDHLLQEIEKERQAAAELASQSGSHRDQLQAVESQLAEERKSVQQLRDQLDQAKAQLSATKVGSIGFMVGWAKSSAATVAAATARKNSLNSENVSSEANPPSPQKDEAATKSAAATTNGNGTKAESPVEEAASHFES